MDEIRKLLEEEIKTQIEDLKTLTPGSEEKSSAIDDLTKLYKLRIEETKSELEQNEEKLKKDQLAEQVKERYFKLGIAAAEIVIPMIFYAVWMNKGFKFEETGTYTSATFRGLWGRFKPTKK